MAKNSSVAEVTFKKFEVIFFKGYLPQILRGLFLNILTHILQAPLLSIFKTMLELA